jgi:selenium metabolism protein YedF
MVSTVDARGLACPQPVILTRNAMREAQEIVTLVDGADQVDNVRRLAEKAGWQVTSERQGAGYAVHMIKGVVETLPELTPDLMVCSTPQPTAATVLVVPSEQMGRGEPELGAILIRTFFHTLTETQPLPKTIIFYNMGVKLAVEGSPVLDDLRALAAKGSEILVCGTCLGYFNLKEQLAVGTISNMYTIAEMLLNAGHILTL